MTALYIILIIAAVIALIIFIPVDAVFSMSCSDKNADGCIFIKYAFVRLKLFPTEREKEEIEADVKTEEKEVERGEKNIRALLKLAKAVYSELRHDIFALISHTFCRTIRIKEINISSHFGTGDPMYTGMAIGAANAAAYNLIAAADRNMRLDNWNVSIDADFDKACLDAGVYCKIRTRIAYVIKLGIMAAILLLKIKKISRRINNNER